MKWVIAFIVSIVLCVLIIGSILIFNSHMSNKTEQWQDANYALPGYAMLLINLNHLFRKLSFVLFPLIIVLSFVGSFLLASKKDT